MPMHRDRLVLGLTAVDKDSKLPVEFATVSLMFRSKSDATKPKKKKRK